MRGLLVAAAVAALAGLGCEAEVVPHTQVIVEVRADPVMEEAADRLVIRVQSGRFGPVEHARTIVDPVFPIEVPVAPAPGTDAEEFTFVGELFSGTGEAREFVGVVRGVIRYVPNELRTVTLTFTHACASGMPPAFRLCSDLETCALGRCLAACITPAAEGGTQIHAECTLTGSADSCVLTDPEIAGTSITCAESRCLCREARGSVCYPEAVATQCCEVPQCSQRGCVLNEPMLAGDTPFCAEGQCACEVNAQLRCVSPEQAEACCDSTPECRFLEVPG